MEYLALGMLILIIIFYGPIAERRMDIYHGRGKYKNPGPYKW